MAFSDYLKLARLAREHGWQPTEICDEQGRTLWMRQGVEGLLPLATLAQELHIARGDQAAA